MINARETGAFDLLYSFVHEHPGGIYQLTLSGVTVSAEYDTDYETDNGADADDAEYEEYIAVVFRNISDNTLFEISCFNFPEKVVYEGKEVL